MLREIKNNLYCMTSYTGRRTHIECENENELAEYIAHKELKGYIVTSVVQIFNDSSNPRIAIKQNEVYKKIIKEYFKNE